MDGEEQRKSTAEHRKPKPLIHGWRRAKELRKPTAEHRKPKPLTLDEEDTRNPTCGSEETFIRNIQLFVLLLVRDRYQTD